MVEESWDERQCEYASGSQVGLIRKNVCVLHQLFGCDSALSDRKAIPERELSTSDDSRNDVERYQLASCHCRVVGLRELRANDESALVSESVNGEFHDYKRKLFQRTHQSGVLGET